MMYNFTLFYECPNCKREFPSEKITFNSESDARAFDTECLECLLWIAPCQIVKHSYANYVKEEAERVFEGGWYWLVHRKRKVDTIMYVDNDGMLFDNKDIPRKSSELMAEGWEFYRIPEVE